METGSSGQEGRSKVNLTPLGIFHTLVSLVAVVTAFVALVRDRQISPRNRIGQIYLLSLLITVLTGFPIFRHGGITPPHVLGVITLAVLAVAAAADKFQVFGRASAYVGTICFSATVFLLMIPTVTEPLTRLPPGAPLVATPEAPIFPFLYATLFVTFLMGVTLQVRRMRIALP